MKKIIIMIIIIIIVTLSLLLLLGKKKENKLLGSWISEGKTIYKFDKNNKGVMIVPLAKYDFRYKVKENKLDIDYVSDKASDAKYTYTLKKDKLILKGEKGTFTFSKYKKKNK